ncbi:MAG TPA: 5-(carboxyamino)imidazole ribonucleotide mutase [Acidobacteriota bacterium]
MAIVLGSKSDRAALDGAVQLLDELAIPHQILVASAHRSPERAAQFARAAQTRGLKVLIAAAGGAAHLAGALAAHTNLPVIGVPLASSPLLGFDALYATVQMPPGVPVATMAVGPWGGINAAVLAAQILALSNPALGRQLERRKAAMADRVERDSRAIESTR